MKYLQDKAGYDKGAIMSRESVNMILALAQEHKPPRLCTTCNITKPAIEFYNDYMNNQGVIYVQVQCKLCKNNYEKERNSTWYKEKHKEICKNYKDKLREEVFTAYGNKCVCCGESRDEFLQIDHINGGGLQHRKEIKKDLYKWLKDKGFPKDEFRILCADCNHAMGMKGYCPHQNEQFDLEGMAC